MTTTTFDIVVTCMGRLEHLRQSLPAMTTQDASRVIVVDYSCPERSGDWVEETYPDVTVVRVPQETHFNMSRARNMGVASGGSPWLLMTDADVILTPGFMEGLLPVLQRGQSYHSHPMSPELMGTVVCAREDFQRVGGYDELFQGWGGEDGDLYHRLGAMGVRPASFPGERLSSIAHSDTLRVANQAIGDKRVSMSINCLYGAAKRDLEQFSRSTQPLEKRKKLYEYARTTVQQSLGPAGEGDLYLVTAQERRFGIERTRVLQYHVNTKPWQWHPGANPPSTRAKTNSAVSTQAGSRPALRDALSRVAQRWPGVGSTSRDDPVFLLASGFRSGSTLLQRCLMSQAFMWGEPYGIADLLPSMAEPFRSLREEWPPDSQLERAPHFAGELRETFVANLFPDPQRLVDAAVAYMHAAFRVPAEARGCTRWGIKEVRYDANMAAFLRFLFPAAHLLFLVRDPYASFLSYRKFQRAWFVSQPGHPINSAQAFGEHWLALARGFHESANELGAFLLRYEDFIAPEYDFTALEAHLGAELDREALKYRVTGHSASDPAPEIDIGKELDALQQVVGSYAGELGYWRD